MTKAGFKPKTVTVVPDKYRPIELSLERKEAAKSPAARIKPRKPARKPPKAKAKAPMAPKPSVKKPAVVPRAKPAPKPKKKNRREMLLD